MSRLSRPNHGQQEPVLNRMLSVAEVSEIIRVSSKLVRDWIGEGLLPTCRLGPNARLVRIRSQDLESFIEQHIRNHDLRKSNGQGERAENHSPLMSENSGGASRSEVNSSMTKDLSTSSITVSPSTAGRFCLDERELTSGDRVFVDINDHLIEGRVEFDANRQHYVVWLGAAAPLQRR